MRETGKPIAQVARELGISDGTTSSMPAAGLNFFSNFQKFACLAHAEYPGAREARNSTGLVSTP